MKNNARCFVICGRVQHGKTTLAHYVAKALGVDYRDCSSVIYREVARRRDITEEQLRNLPKEDIRQQLIEVGDFLCANDPAFLPKHLYYGESIRIIPGVRRVAELSEFINAIGKENVIPIWILRPDGVDIKDNTEIELEKHCPVKVINNSTAHALEQVGKALIILQECPGCEVEFRPPKI